MTNHRCISDGLRRLRDCCRKIHTGWIKSPPALNEDGGALIEFTVMAPLFFLIVFGIIEWGSIFYLQNNMVNAAREGARSYAVQGLTPAAANTTACGWLTGTGQSFTISTADQCPALQDVKVSISVDAAKASIFNYLGMFTGVTFASSTTMRRELVCPAAPPGVVTCTCNTTVTPPVCN